MLYVSVGLSSVGAVVSMLYVSVGLSSVGAVVSHAIDKCTHRLDPKLAKLATSVTAGRAFLAWRAQLRASLRRRTALHKASHTRVHACML